MKNVPNIEAFTETLFRLNKSYLPVAELGIHPLIKEKMLGRKIETLSDDVAFWHKAGYDYIKLQPQADFNPDGIGLEGKLTFNEDGTLVRKWASHGSGPIASRADFEKYRFPEASSFGYKSFEDVRSVLPEGMGVIGQYGDIFTMTWEMMGFENFSMAIFMEPDLVKALNEKLGNLVLSMFEYFAQNENVDALWYSDDIAYSNALMVSPETLELYFFPWLKKIGDLARKYNKPLIYHTDGILYDVLDRIIECGVNALHPIEPKAMKIADIKKRYGNQLCLMGHVDVDLLSRGTAEQVRKQVLKNIEEAAADGGYCVGSGNSVPEYVLFENYLEMLRTADKAL